MPSIVLYVSQGPAANYKAFPFLIMIYNFLIMSRFAQKCFFLLLMFIDRCFKLSCRFSFHCFFYLFQNEVLQVSPEEGGICISAYGRVDLPFPFY